MNHLRFSLRIVNSSELVFTAFSSESRLTNLNGLEFCENLEYLECSESLKASVKILKAHLPNLRVKCR
jgi:hypothetical protein